MTVAASKTYTTKILKEGQVTGLQVPFDPEPVFGKTRAPVKVTLNGYTYRSTIAAPPADLAKALKAAGAWERWKEMSFTHQREWAQAVEDAKKPETRARRIENAVAEIGARAAKAT